MFLLCFRPPTTDGIFFVFFFCPLKAPCTEGPFLLLVNFETSLTYLLCRLLLDPFSAAWSWSCGAHPLRSSIYYLVMIGIYDSSCNNWICQISRAKRVMCLGEIYLRRKIYIYIYLSCTFSSSLAYFYEKCCNEWRNFVLLFDFLSSILTNIRRFVTKEYFTGVSFFFLQSWCTYYQTKKKESTYLKKYVTYFGNSCCFCSLLKNIYILQNLWIKKYI